MKLPDHKRPVAFDSEYFLATVMDDITALMMGARKEKLAECRISSAAQVIHILSVITK